MWWAIETVGDFKKRENMFLTKEELGSVMYGYQITQITQGDDAVILQAIAAAIVEVKSYLTANNKKSGAMVGYNMMLTPYFQPKATIETR
nr:hypothetical protein [Flavobacterium covae]